MQSKAASVDVYLKSLPADRRAAVQAVREVILANLDSDYAEGMQYGMIGYYVPLSRYPEGYHCTPKMPLPFAALAAQKNYFSLYLMGLYCGSAEGLGGAEGETADARWFREAWTRTGKKLDMGKACVRFKNLADVPLEVVGEAIRRLPAKDYIARYEAGLASLGKVRSTGRDVKTPKSKAASTAKAAESSESAAKPKKSAKR
ncbi:MAG: DUF1801 domain-containing protein [Planctomycetes bacterium]|nr:DUF1801 domain-containing protein [Planctomycetota bacterium]